MLGFVKVWEVWLQRKPFRLRSSATVTQGSVALDLGLLCCG